MTSFFDNYSSASFFPSSGLDTSTGKKVGAFQDTLQSPKKYQDLFKKFQKSGTSQYGKTFQPGAITATATGEFPTAKPVPDSKDMLTSYIEAAKAFMPLTTEQYGLMSDIATKEQLKQMAAYMPLSMLAQRASIAANLQASKDYQSYVQNLPLVQQEIAASKQAQAATAAAGEADLLRAVATAQDAASRYPGRFAGQYIQVG